MPKSNVQQIEIIIDHLSKISIGKCSITEKSILNEEDPNLRKILTALLSLNQDLEGRESQRRRAEETCLQLETQLRQAQKVSAMGTHVFGIAHEFNNLLTPILGFTDMLMRSKSKEDQDLKKLIPIQSAGNRGKELVQQMLAYGRKPLSQKTVFHLEELLNDNFKLLKNTIPSNILIKKEVDVNLPPVLGMPNEFQQILFNLCLNATHAMPEGGTLTVRLTNEGFRQFVNQKGKEREGHFTSLMVEDTGIGMDPTTLEQIYDPFFTTKEMDQGTGLGLSVVQDIVEQHEGHIEVESKVGVGTTFHVYFPFDQEDGNPSVENTASLSKGDERILLIEDEPMNAKLVKSILDMLGYQVTYFLDSAEAWKHFRDVPQDFDLVMTDYGMPKMNGKQLAEKLKAIRPDIPIILLTGHSNLVAKEDLHGGGMEALLMKPFTLEKISEVVRGVLDK